MTKIENYISPLTSLRFMGCVWIVIAHYSRFLMAGKELFSGHFFPFLSNARNALDLFFVLSGFILGHVYKENFQNISMKEIKLYYKRRIARIYPAYIFSLLVVITLIKIGINTEVLGDYSTRSLLLNIFLIQSWGFSSDLSWNIPAWTVSTEIQIYLAFPFIIYFMRTVHKNISYILLLILFFLVASHIIPHLVPAKNRAAHSLLLGYGIFWITPDFMIGYLCYSLIEKINSKYRCEIPWDIFTIMSFFAFIICSEFSYNHLAVLLSIAWLITSLSQSQSLSKIIFGFPLLVFLGETSYSMYLLQFPLEILSNYLIGGEVDNLSTGGLLMLFILHMLILIGLSVTSYVFIERPCRKFINQTKWSHFPTLMKSKLAKFYAT